MNVGAEECKAARAPGMFAAVLSCPSRGAFGGVAIPASPTCAATVIAGGDTSILAVPEIIACVKQVDKGVTLFSPPVAVSESEFVAAVAELGDTGDISPSAQSFDDPDAEVEEVTEDPVEVWRLRGASFELSRLRLGIWSV
jgi:hypothetical protein